MKTWVICNKATGAAVVEVYNAYGEILSPSYISVPILDYLYRLNNSIRTDKEAI